MTQEISKSRRPETDISLAGPGTVSAGTSVGGVPGGVTPPVRVVGRQGFLPIKTNTFDRVFISVLCFVAIHLIWMRFIEAFIPLWVATILTIVLAIYIILRG
jgi:hypothetical protein